jgi:hypothetical protein
MSAVESLLGDRYTREARIAPAFLCVFPVVILLMACFSGMQSAAPALLTLMCVFGVVRWISHIARAVGDRIEIDFFRKWGGKPTTTMLRVALGYEEPKNVKCDDWVRHILQEAAHAEQFKRILAALKAPEIPSKSEDEKAVLDAGGHAYKMADNLDALYEPLVAWLRENSRGKNLVFEELISYGFQRNFYALKSFALWSNGLALLVQVGAIWGVYHWQQHAWATKPEMAAVILAANLLYLAGVCRFVSEKSVKVQGFIYARQLFNSFYGAGPADGTADAKKPVEKTGNSQ